MRDLVYYVAASLDGFIADPGGDTSAFPTDPQTLAALFDRYPETCPAHLREALGVSGEPRRFDTVLMGYRTHEPALAAGLTSAYPHLRQVVATHRDLPADHTVETISGDVSSTVAELKNEDGRDIWLCGGGLLAAALIDQIDELQIKVNPVLLGTGVPLFAQRPADTPTAPRVLQLIASEALPGGVTLLTYRTAPSTPPHPEEPGAN